VVVITVIRGGAKANAFCCLQAVRWCRKDNKAGLSIVNSPKETPCQFSVAKTHDFTYSIKNEQHSTCSRILKRLLKNNELVFRSLDQTKHKVRMS
jgi:hypothetical protein